MKTVIITGANGNLGTAVTNEFLAKGYTVAATVLHDHLKSGIGRHPNLHITTVDLNDEQAAHAFVQSAIEQYKTIDAALLLVGGFAMGDVAGTSAGDIRKQLALNFETAYHVVQPLLPHMLANSYGRMVFIGARPALEPASGKDMIAYGLSKSLLFKLAEYINAGAKGKDVTAAVIVPSTLDTPANRQSMPDTDPSIWVKPGVLAGILEFIVSDSSGPLRETVLKVYNNA
jgi:NAD(P)-dependent dehydrogenase (short-subunit alcohol dehydrogenase family)